MLAFVSRLCSFNPPLCQHFPIVLQLSLLLSYGRQLSDVSAFLQPLEVAASSFPEPIKDGSSLLRGPLSARLDPRTESDSLPLPRPLYIMASETPPVYLKYVNKRRQALLAADPQPQEATLQPATAGAVCFSVASPQQTDSCRSVTLKNDPVADRFFICAEEHVAGCLAQEEHVVVEWFDQPRYWGLMPPEIRKELLTKPLMGARKLLAAAAENDLLMIAIKRCVVDQSSYADMLPAWTATVKRARAVFLLE